MKHRGNILPRWLQKAGYTTALIGKWLNGYGAKDAHGEMPKGFEIWRGLLDVSAYDYFNFVMNLNGALKTWGDPVFAEKLVRFAKIEVRPAPAPSQPIPEVLVRATRSSSRATSAPIRPGLAPDVAGMYRRGLVRRKAK